MSLAMVATSVLVGLIAGWLAGIVMKGGGYGLKGDMILGLVGSIVASWIFQTTGVSPEAGMFGAAIVIVGQRKVWSTQA